MTGGRKTAAVPALAVAAVSLLGPLSICVDGAYSIEDLQAFAALLPANCEDNILGLVDCFVAGLADECKACFDDAFESTPLPETLPGTCVEATDGGLMGTICDLRSCCTICDEEIASAWWCTMEGEEIKSDDGSDDLCGLDCPDLPAASGSGGDSAVSMPGGTETSEGGVFASLGCPEEVEDLSTCIEGNLATCSGPCGDIFLSLPQEILPGQECVVASNVLCGLESCCTACGTETAAAMDCAREVTLDDGTTCPVNCEAMKSGPTDGDDGNMTVDMGDDKNGTEAGQAKEEGIKGDGDDDGEEGGTTTPSPTGGDDGTSASCKFKLQAFSSCVKSNAGTCGTCAVNAMPEEAPATCAGLANAVCEVKGCCSECQVQLDDVVKVCGGKIGAGTGTNGNGDGKCDVDCEASEEPSKEGDVPIDARSDGCVDGVGAAAMAAVAGLTLAMV